MELINSLVKDLQTFSMNDLNKLANFYGISPDLNLIAKNNLRFFQKRAQMPSVYKSDQISQVVNHLNSKLKTNTCLRHMLVIRNYTDRSENWYDTRQLHIYKQKYDIYENELPDYYSTINELTFQNDITPLIHDINTVNGRFCCFVLWAMHDSTKKETPVINSHLTLVVFDKLTTEPNIWNVFKYNSSFVNAQDEFKMDLGILAILRDAQNTGDRQFNLVPTESWCPKSLQKNSNLCTVFVFNIYYVLTKYRRISIHRAIQLLVQTPNNIMHFFNKLSESIPGLGSVMDIGEMYL